MTHFQFKNRIGRLIQEYMSEKNFESVSINVDVKKIDDPKGLHSVKTTKFITTIE